MKRLRKAASVSSAEMEEILKKVSGEIGECVRNQLFDIWKIPDEQAELRDRLLSESYRIFRAQRNIMEYMRIVSGKYKLNENSIDLTAELDKLCADIRNVTDRKKIQFSSKLPTEKIIIVCDIERLGLSILSMVLNAINSGTKDSKVSLRVTADEKNIKVIVRDKGRGMSEEVLKQCMNPFYSFNPEGEKGLGLGMTLTRYFAAESGGRFTVKSKEGVGTETKFTLPRVNADSASEVRQKTELVYDSLDITRVALSALDI